MSEKPTILVKTLPHGEGLDLPAYSNPGDSGFDLRAAVHEPFTLHPGDRALVPTGIALGLPEGYEIQVRPRSGLAIKHGITILNTPGTVDWGYTGEMKIILFNTSDKPFTINRGDRIAQAVLAPVVANAWLTPADDLGDRQRGAAGFGSTGTQ